MRRWVGRQADALGRARRRRRHSQPDSMHDFIQDATGSTLRVVEPAACLRRTSGARRAHPLAPVAAFPKRPGPGRPARRPGARRLGPLAVHLPRAPQLHVRPHPAQPGPPGLVRQRGLRRPGRPGPRILRRDRVRRRAARAHRAGHRRRPPGAGSPTGRSATPGASAGTRSCAPAAPRTSSRPASTRAWAPCVLASALLRNAAEGAPGPGHLAGHQPRGRLPRQDRAVVARSSTW